MTETFGFGKIEKFIETDILGTKIKYVLFQEEEEIGYADIRIGKMDILPVNTDAELNKHATIIAYIEYIYIRDKFKKSGYGTMLLKNIINDFKFPIYLLIAPLPGEDIIPLLKFYCNSGFMPVKEWRSTYNTPIILMYRFRNSKL